MLDLFLTNKETHHCFMSSSFLCLFCYELKDDSFLYLTTVSHYWPHSVTSSTTSLTVSNHFHLRCARSAPPCLFLDAPCSCHASQHYAYYDHCQCFSCARKQMALSLTCEPRDKDGCRMQSPVMQV